MSNDNDRVLVETAVIEVDVMETPGIGATIGDGTLQLNYAFYPTPNPIRASLGGLNPVQSTCDLQILINTAALSEVSISQININIPTGSVGDTGVLSASPLPAPQPASQPTDDKKDTWFFSVSGDVVTIQTQSGQPATITLATLLDFTLPGIIINEAGGTVQLSITETPPSPPVTDDSTYTLEKLPADFPVINFYAQPVALYELDQTITLHWTCSTQGQNYSYNLHSDSWQPRDCLNAGHCYTWQDGQSGVASPRLEASTTFALDVITTDARGNHSISHTLYLQVPVLVPAVVNFYLDSYLSGHAIKLYWLAQNATYCTVELDGNTILKNLPSDTYDTGYLVALDGSVAAGTHQLSITAYNTGGIPHPSNPITVTVSGLTTIPVGLSPYCVAVNNQQALVTNRNSNTVSVIDLTTQPPQPDPISPNPIAVGSVPTAIAITPDGKFALVLNRGDATVTFIDIAARTTSTVTGFDNELISTVQGFTTTPDGTLALVSDSYFNVVYVINIVTRLVETPAIQIGPRYGGLDMPPSFPAITPDGKFALVPGMGGSVSVININERQVEANGFPANCINLAITPDGKFALVPDYGANRVRIIDITSIAEGRLQEVAQIPVGDYAQNIAITPDSTLACVVNSWDNSVSLIDIANRQAASQTIAVGGEPFGVAITPDGKHILVVNPRDNTVTMM